MTFLRNTILTFATTAGTTVVNLLVSVLLARTLGPEGRGMMVTVLLWPQVLAWVSSLSLAAANTYLGAAEPGIRRALFANSLLVTLVLGTIIGVASALLVPRFVPLTDVQRVLITISLLTLPLALCADCWQTLLMSTNRFDQVNLVRLSVPIVLTTTLVLMWAAGTLTMTGAVIANWMSGCASFVLLLYFLRLHGYVSLRPDFALLWRSLGYGVRVHLGTLTQLANARLDQLLMTGLVTPRTLGLYALAVTVSELLNQVSAAVALVLTPHMASEISEEARRVIAAKSARWVLLIGLVGAAVLYPVAPLVVGLLWGDKFAAAVPTIRVLLPGTVALGMAATLNASLRGVGRPLPGTIAEAVSLVITIPLLLALLPRYGIIGAGLAASTGYMLKSLVLMGYFGQYFGRGSLLAIKPTPDDWQEICLVAGALRARILKRSARAL